MKKQLLISAVVGLVLGLVAIPALAQSGPDVGIDSTVMIPHKAIYFDANNDGTNQPEEMVGEYDVYNAAMLLNFHWLAVPDATYYRISLRQYAPPGKGEPSASTLVKVSHHSASDPNGPRFSMSVGDGLSCLDCVTIVQAQPETMSLAADGVTRIYTLLGTSSQVSGPFVLEFLPNSRSGSGAGAFGPVCGDGMCTPSESNEAALHWCPKDCDN